MEKRGKVAKNSSKNSSKRGFIETRTETLAEPIVQAHGCRIYDLEYVRDGDEYFLNIYIDKEDGVTINDCEAVSREISDALDAEDYISDVYTLVVSSPGLGRTLTKDRHLQGSLGEEVEVHLYAPLPDTGEKELVGVLTDFDADTVSIEAQPPKLSKTQMKKRGITIDPDAVRPLTLPRKNIALIRLTLDF